MLLDIWSTIDWNRVPAKGPGRASFTHSPYLQFRIFPHHKKDKVFRRYLRDKHLNKWEFAGHWVDSAEKTAFSIMDSWKQNYNKGDRKGVCPHVERLFARVKQDLAQLSGDILRITTRPHECIYIDLSRRYFRLPARLSASDLGEPILTPNRIHLPISAR